MATETMTLRITGTVSKPKVKFSNCQTCGGILDITIPFEMPGETTFPMLASAGKNVKGDDVYKAKKNSKRPPAAAAPTKSAPAKKVAAKKK